MTDFKNGVSSYGIPLIGGQGLTTQGKSIFVKPYSGSDGNTGLSLNRPVKTLTKALSLATANQNDVVYLCAEHNTAASTTDYQTSTDAGLVWNKNLVHLVGIGNFSMIGQRARIAWVSTINNTTNTPLFTLSAAGCNIINVAFFSGVNDAQSIGAVKITGQRNYIYNCQISGIGHDTNDVAGAYSLMIDGGAENTIENCFIGLDTIARGSAANSEILIDTAATRNIIKNCFISSYPEHTTNSPQVKLADATAIDRFLWFKNCTFYNFSPNYAIKQDGIMQIPVLTQGFVLVDTCVMNSGTGAATKWDVNDSNKILVFNSPIPAADTPGMSYPV